MAVDAKYAPVNVPAPASAMNTAGLTVKPTNAAPVVKTAGVNSPTSLRSMANAIRVCGLHNATYASSYAFVSLMPTCRIGARQKSHAMTWLEGKRGQRGERALHLMANQMLFFKE